MTPGKAKGQKNQSKSRVRTQGSGTIPPPVINKIPVSRINEFPTTPFPDSVFKAHPVAEFAVQKWCFEKNVAVRRPDNPDGISILNMGTIVTVGQQNIQVPGDPNRWAEIKYTHREYSKEKREWVHSEVIGWVNEIYLDDYRVNLLNKNEQRLYLMDGVEIKNQTADPTDAQQYMVWDKSTTDRTDLGIRYNMCGELCVAYIVKKELDPNSSIESVLEKWKSAPKEKKGSFSYTLSTIKAGTTALHLQDILQLYPEYSAVPDSDRIMDLRTGLNLAKDSPFKWDDIRKTIRTHYLIAHVIIDKTGTLIPRTEARERAGIAHWVLVENLTCDGKWVVLYNPFPNRVQEYSFTEFIASCSILSGLWVKKKSTMECASIDVVPKPNFRVELGIPRPLDYRGAEQYIDREGGRKTNLCGEFAVAYILTRSTSSNLKKWKEKEPGESQGFLPVLKAYGSFGNQPSDCKSFSIGTVLDHWRDVQPLLYGKHVIDNETTSSEPLKSILRAYGYTTPGDFVDFTAGLTDPVTKKYLPSPGRMMKMLEKYFLIAGVGINKKGVVKNRGAIRHWVVVEQIRPVGRHYLTKHFGGSGGWVELYNPFMNAREEYSYLEFANSMSETGLWSAGLWVKRDVDPVFTSQPVLTPRQNVNKPGTKIVGRGRKIKPQKKGKVKPPRGVEARKLKKRALRADVVAAVSTPADHRETLEAFVCRNLQVISIPPEIIRWISIHSKGNLSLAVALATTLRTFNLLTFTEGKGIFNQEGELGAGQLENQAASEIGPAFAWRAMEEIRTLKTAL